MTLSKTDLDDLRRAKNILEHPGLAAKLSSLAGAPIEKGMKMLPKRWQQGVHSATEKALMKALDIAVRSMGEKKLSVSSSDKLHKLAVAASDPGLSGPHSCPRLLTLS